MAPDRFCLAAPFVQTVPAPVLSPRCASARRVVASGQRLAAFGPRVRFPDSPLLRVPIPSWPLQTHHSHSRAASGARTEAWLSGCELLQNPERLTLSGLAATAHWYLCVFLSCRFCCMLALAGDSFLTWPAQRRRRGAYARVGTRTCPRGMGQQESAYTSSSMFSVAGLLLGFWGNLHLLHGFSCRGSPTTCRAVRSLTRSGLPSGALVMGAVVHPSFE